MLEAKARNSWLDPRLASDEKEFLYKYAVAWGTASAADEILKFVLQAKATRDTLLAKKEGSAVNKFKIGG